MCSLRKASQTPRTTHGCWRRRKSKLIVLRGVKICMPRLVWPRQMCAHGAMRQCPQAALLLAGPVVAPHPDHWRPMAVLVSQVAWPPQALLGCQPVAQGQAQPTLAFNPSSSGTTPTWAAQTHRRKVTSTDSWPPAALQPERSMQHCLSGRCLTCKTPCARPSVRWPSRRHSRLLLRNPCSHWRSPTHPLHRDCLVVLTHAPKRFKTGMRPMPGEPTHRRSQTLKDSWPAATQRKRSTQPCRNLMCHF